MIARFNFAIFIVLASSSVSYPQSMEPIRWSQLPSIPDKVGFAGPFAGTHNGVLLVAGGANFPDRLPWEGGTKVWYDSVFKLDKPDGRWKVAGKLPRPLGYGVSLSTSEGVFCIGGSDANQHYPDCFRLQWNHGELHTTILPNLPKPCANFCGAVIGNTIYVAGGIETPTSTNAMKTFWSLDLAAKELHWQALEPWPGAARMLGVTAVCDDLFYLVSGADLSSDEQGKPVRTYLTDAYCYRPGVGWNRIADLPRPTVAAPTPAPTKGSSRFLILSGDDGSLVNFLPADAHPGFPKSILAYDALTDSWQTVGEVPAGHVTTSIVQWNDRFVMPNGEIRPGVRTPTVWSFK